MLYFDVGTAGERAQVLRRPVVHHREATLDEQHLIKRARAGKADAFEQLVEMHAPVIWTVINRMVMDADQAKDLFQETVVRFWKGLSGFQGNSKLSTWLYRIAYRVCLDALESANARTMTSLDAKVEAQGFEPDDEQSSGQRLESNLAASDAVERALSRLRPEWKAMIILYYWKEMSVEEVAEVTGRPVNTVKVYLHRARAQLRQVLENGGYPPED